MSHARVASAVLLVSSLLGWSDAAAGAEPKPTLVLMPLQASGLSPAAVATLDELLADFVRRLGRHRVIGKSDVEAMLGLEKVKDQLACDDVLCAADLGGALGAELLLTGRVAKLGDSIIVVLKLIHARQQQVLGSVTQKAPDDENLYDRALQEAARRLFGIDTAPEAAELDAPRRDRGWFANVGAGTTLPVWSGRSDIGGVQASELEPGFVLRAGYLFGSGLVTGLTVSRRPVAFFFQGGESARPHWDGALPPRGVYVLGETAVGATVGYATAGSFSVQPSVSLELVRSALDGGESADLPRARTALGLAGGATVLGIDPEVTLQARLGSMLAVGLRFAAPLVFLPQTMIWGSEVQLVVTGTLPSAR